jgi:hypothetical protein
VIEASFVGGAIEEIEFLEERVNFKRFSKTLEKSDIMKFFASHFQSAHYTLMLIL